MLAATVGVPYVWWNGKSVTEGWFGGSSEKTEAGGNATAHAPPATPTAGGYAASYGAYPMANAPATGGYGYPYTTSVAPAGTQAAAPPAAMPPGFYAAPVELPPPELHEAINLNVTPAWVTARWPRVTTTLAETNFDGLRVALTGVREGDLTGSLTYYFDKQQTVQRITFHGATGNQQRLAELLLGQFSFTKQKCLAGELYTASWMGRTHGMCRIRPAPVMSAATAPQRYEVLLEINRPGLRSKLSDMAKQLIQQDRQAKLW
jgi:hypothetical protein